MQEYQNMLVTKIFSCRVGRFAISLPLDQDQGEVVIDLKPNSTFYKRGIGFHDQTELRIQYPIEDSQVIGILRKISENSYVVASGEEIRRKLLDRTYDPADRFHDPAAEINNDPELLLEFQNEVFENLLENWEIFKSKIIRVCNHGND